MAEERIPIDQPIPNLETPWDNGTSAYIGKRVEAFLKQEIKKGQESSGKTIASATQLGVIMVGYNLTIDANGKLSAGNGIAPKGAYNSLAELKAAHPTGTAGECYLVNSHVYIWTVSKSDWVDGGTIGSGGGGVSSYPDLTNKPQLNGTEINGSQSLDDFGIQEEISDLQSIRENAAKGATALQQSDITNELGQATNKAISQKAATDTLMDLSGKVDDLTEKLTRSIEGSYNAELGELTLTWSDENLQVEADMAKGEISFVY